jgi:hypothetical protein
MVRGLYETRQSMVEHKEGEVHRGDAHWIELKLI